MRVSILGFGGRSSSRYQAVVYGIRWKNPRTHMWFAEIQVVSKRVRRFFVQNFGYRMKSFKTDDDGLEVIVIGYKNSPRIFINHEPVDLEIIKKKKAPTDNIRQAQKEFKIEVEKLESTFRCIVCNKPAKFSVETENKPILGRDIGISACVCEDPWHFEMIRIKAGAEPLTKRPLEFERW